jgi:hypothetical protein
MYDFNAVLNFTDDFNNEITTTMGSKYNIKIYKIDNEKALLSFTDKNYNIIEVPEDLKLYLKFDEDNYNLIKYYDKNTNTYSLYANENYKLVNIHEKITLLIENKKLFVFTKI